MPEAKKDDGHQSKQQNQIEEEENNYSRPIIIPSRKSIRLVEKRGGVAYKIGEVESMASKGNAILVDPTQVHKYLCKFLINHLMMFYYRKHIYVK